MNSWSPLVSVIMAVHNGELFLRDAVDSILAQIYRNFEFIIIDDASTDCSGEILAGYSDERIVRVSNETNLGLTASLNIGIGRARGELIARQDADDVSLPERFVQQVEFLRAHPEVGLVGTDYQVIDDQGRILETVSLSLTSEQIQQRLAEANVFVHSTVMVHRDILEQVGGYRNYFRMSQDYDLFLRIAECSQLAILPVVLHQFRIHSASGSRQKHESQLAYKQLASELARRRRHGLPEGPWPDDLLQQYPPERARLFSDARGVSYLYYAAGRPKTAEEMILQALSYQPTSPDPAAEWVEWIVDRANRIARSRQEISAGVDYLRWIIGVLRGSNVRLPERTLIARYYAEQAFYARHFGANRNGPACALRAILLDPKWAKNLGLWKIVFIRSPRASTI